MIPEFAGTAQAYDIPAGNTGLSLVLIHRWLQITGRLNNQFVQNFSFDPGQPRVYFLDENGQRVKFTEAATGETPLTEIPLAALGRSLKFIMPAGGRLYLKPVITLPDARFANKTRLEADAYFGSSVFSGTAGVSYSGIRIMGLNWDFGLEEPIGTFGLNIAEPNFAVGNMGTITAEPIVILGNGAPPVITATSRTALPMYMFNQQQVGQPVNYARVRQAFERYLTSSTSLVVYGDNFNATTTRFFFRHLGQKFEFKANPQSAYDGVLRWVTKKSVVLTVPNFLRALPGNSTLIAEDSVTGNSNSFDLPVVNPVPNVATVGPNLWASNPKSGQVFITVSDARDARGSDTFYARRDYFLRLDQLWTDIFDDLDVPANLKSLTTFFPSANIRSGSNFTSPILPLIQWDMGSGVLPLRTYGDPNPSGLLWAVLPDDYFKVATQVGVSIVTGGPGGGTSSRLSATISSPKPVISGLDPVSVIPGSDGFTLDLTGPENVDPTGATGKQGNFNPDSVVYFDGQPLKTQFVTSSFIKAEVPASLIANSKTASITVQNPSNNTTYFEDGIFKPSGGTSNAMAFAVASPVPVVERISPKWVYQGAFNTNRVRPRKDVFNFSVVGDGFTKKTVVVVDGVAVKTTFKNSNLIVCNLPSSVSASVGNKSVIAQTTESDGKALKSVSQTLTVRPPVTIASISADTTKILGGTSLSLTLSGSEAAPDGGVNGTLVSSDKSLIGNRNFQLAPGQSILTLVVPTAKTTTNKVVTLTLKQEFVADRVVSITVVPSGVADLDFVPSRFDSGDSTVGTITLGDVAPRGGASVQLTTVSGLGLTYPAIVVVPEGQKTAKFTVSSSPFVNSNGDPAVTVLRASYLSEATSSVSLNPLGLSSFSLSAASVTKGSDVTLTLTLSKVAPTAVSVRLSVNDPALRNRYFSNFPATITVPAGSRVATYSLKTVAGAASLYPASIAIDALYNQKTVSQSLLINN